MKIIRTALMLATAAFVFTAADANAGWLNKDKDSKNANQVGVDKSAAVSHKVKAKDGSYTEVHYEGNKKITTRYTPIGTRKVGLVGGEPYGVNRNNRLVDGGDYYTQDGVKYFRDTRKLDVEYQGSFND